MQCRRLSVFPVFPSPLLSVHIFLLPLIEFHLTFEVHCEAELHRVRQTARESETDSSAIFCPVLKHYSNLYISKGLYEQLNWEYKEKWTQHIYAPVFSPGKKSKVKWRGEAQGRRCVQLQTALRSKEVFWTGFLNNPLLKFPSTGAEMSQLQHPTVRTLLVRILTGYWDEHIMSISLLGRRANVCVCRCV